MAENVEKKYMKNTGQIFSSEALNKMRSPEKLDEILPITTPITWMGLIAVAVSIFSVIFGSFRPAIGGTFFSTRHVAFVTTPVTVIF